MTDVKTLMQLKVQQQDTETVKLNRANRRALAQDDKYLAVKTKPPDMVKVHD